MKQGGPMKSPDDAAAEIRQLLSVYIQQHQDLKTSAWYERANAGFVEFNVAFPQGKSHNLDEIKAHVLNRLAPNFVVFVKWILRQHGSSTLRTDLENAANSWPSHQEYLVYAAEQKAAKAEADKLALVKEKEVVEAAKAALLREKEEKAKLAEESEAARQILLKRQEALEKQLAELTLQNQGSVPAAEVDVLTKRVATLQLLNQQLVEKTVADRAAPLLPTPVAAVAIEPQPYLEAAKKAFTGNETIVVASAANESSVTSTTTDPVQKQTGRRRNNKKQ